MKYLAAVLLYIALAVPRVTAQTGISWHYDAATKNTVITVSNDTDKDITEVGLMINGPDGPDEEYLILPYLRRDFETFPARSTKQISLPSSKAPPSIEIGVVTYSDATAYVVSKPMFANLVAQRKAALAAAQLASKTLRESSSYQEAGNELSRLSKVYARQVTNSEDEAFAADVGMFLANNYVSAFEQNVTREQFEKLIDDDIALWTKHSQLTEVQQ